MFTSAIWFEKILYKFWEIINPPVTISLSDRLGHFFQSGFWPNLLVTIHSFTDQGFFHFFFLKHIFDPKCKWPYTVSQTGFTKDPVLSRGMVTDVPVSNVLERKL